MSSELSVNIDSCSTTFAYKTSESVIDFEMPLGSVNLADKFFVEDPPDAAELSAALSVVELYIDDFVRKCGEVPITTKKLVGQGHISDLAAVEVGDGRLSPDMNGYSFDLSAAEEVFRWIATEDAHDRALNPGVAEGAEVRVLGAATILVEIMRQLDMEEIEVRLIDESS